MKITIISSAYPPDLDGIGDYTCILARALARGGSHDVTVYTSGKRESTAEHLRIEGILRGSWRCSFRDLKRTISEGDMANWVVIQYNPFCFGRRGFCPWVPKLLQDLRKQKRRPGLAVMFHETMVPRWPWRFAVMYLWQYPIFRAICRSADIAFVSTERWKGQVKAVCPNLRCEYLPVFSNVKLCDVTQSTARTEIGIAESTFVCGIFGSAHISRLLDWSAEAAMRIVEARERAGRSRDILLLYVGADGSAVTRAFGACGITVLDAGVIPSDRVGVYLRAMDVVLSPFSDGVSTRRGSVLAALQHGVPVATNLTKWSDTVFHEATKLTAFAAPKGDISGFSERVAEMAGAKENHDLSVPCIPLMRFYEENFGPDRTSERLVEFLKDVQRWNSI